MRLVSTNMTKIAPAKPATAIQPPVTEPETVPMTVFVNQDP